MGTSHYRVRAEDLENAEASLDLPMDPDLIFDALLALNDNPPSRFAAVEGVLDASWDEIKRAVAALPAGLPEAPPEIIEAFWEKTRVLMIWGLLLRADAFSLWLEERRDMVPLVSILLEEEDGRRLLGRIIGAVPLELKMGEPPLVGEDISHQIRGSLVAIDHPVLLFVETEPPGEDRKLKGIGMALPVLLDWLNTQPAMPVMLLTLHQAGYGDPYEDLRLENQEKLFQAYEDGLREEGVDFPGMFREMDPGNRAGMFLVHLVRLAALEDALDLLGDDILEESTLYAVMAEEKVFLRQDGVSFCFNLRHFCQALGRPLEPLENEDALRDEPDGYVGQPEGQAVFSEEAMARIRGLEEASLADLMPSLGDQFGDVTFEEFTTRLRVSVNRVSRSAMKAYLARLGWHLDLSDLDPDEPVVHLAHLGWFGMRPVYAYAAPTPPLDWDDKALEWALEGVEEIVEDEFVDHQGEWDEEIERPVLLCIDPMFQEQRDPKTRILKRLLIQGGWIEDAQEDLAWRPFFLSKAGDQVLEDGAAYITDDRIPLAVFARHGQAKEALDALKDLLLARHALVPEELRAMTGQVTSRDEIQPVPSRSTWMGLAGRSGLETLEMISRMSGL